MKLIDFIHLSGILACSSFTTRTLIVTGLVIITLLLLLDFVKAELLAILLADRDIFEVPRQRQPVAQELNFHISCFVFEVDVGSVFQQRLILLSIPDHSALYTSLVGKWIEDIPMR